MQIVCFFFFFFFLYVDVLQQQKVLLQIKNILSCVIFFISFLGNVALMQLQKTTLGSEHAIEINGNQK